MIGYIVDCTVRHSTLTVGNGWIGGIVGYSAAGYIQKNYVSGMLIAIDRSNIYDGSRTYALEAGYIIGRSSNDKSITGNAGSANFDTSKLQVVKWTTGALWWTE